MAVKGRKAMTEAQENQIPPELRRFARHWCDGVESLDRFDADCERTGCGWTLKAEKVRTGELPDGYETSIASVHGEDGVLRVQIREA